MSPTKRRSRALRDAGRPRRSARSISSLCCAGITRRAPTLEMDTAEWQRIVDVNLMGTLRAFKAFAPRHDRARRRDG